MYPIFFPHSVSPGVVVYLLWPHSSDSTGVLSHLLSVTTAFLLSTGHPYGNDTTFQRQGERGAHVCTVSVLYVPFTFFNIVASISKQINKVNKYVSGSHKWNIVITGIMNIRTYGKKLQEAMRPSSSSLSLLLLGTVCIMSKAEWNSQSRPCMKQM